ncbi:antitoxin HicB [Methylomagnum ishizawai]|uniref:Antitoxin HicB n=1 Tax=Methylomagnum ishizawai TaxID=1760988 RepID=A0A1Y6CU18_9GAMM|nr:type II toxin-antitoxin system HicB family antitoxin [Methylomagnum ishizawai]SMF93921.1 antitoxin HicB [Methylomagnum ishizawai]
MLKFPAHFEPDEKGIYFVSFRDIPEAVTQGLTLEEARGMALDVLISAMDFYIEDSRRVPEPSPAEAGEEWVELPLSMSAKVMLLNEMIEKQIRPADLARAIGVKPQEMTRIMDLHHATKIDTLAKAFSAVGKRLELHVA